MAGSKRPARVADIDMTPAGDASSSDPSTNVMSMTTVTIPALKRIRASRKSRLHELLNTTSSPNPALELLALGSANVDRVDDANANAPKDEARDVANAPMEEARDLDVDGETRAAEADENINVYIGDDDPRSASVR